MTSSTTRAFMAKKPFATASVFMAKTNQLLSTMARLRLLLVMFVALSVSAEVWAEKTIASWGCISIQANSEYKAADGDVNNKNVAHFSSSKSMTTSGTNAYYGASAGGAVITFSNLDLSNYTDVTISFYSRASKAGVFNLSYSNDGTSYQLGNSSGTLATSNTPKQYSIALPSTSEDITNLKLSHNQSSGSLYFGTVTITGTEKATAAQHTVTFDAGSGSCSTSTFTQTSTTRSVNLPPASTTCEGWTFAGWCTYSAGNQDENSTSPGTIFLPGTSYTPNSTHTLYAVYTRSESGGTATSYVKVSADNVTTGTYVIAAIRSSSVSSNYYPATGSISSGDMVVSDKTFTLTNETFTEIPDGGIEFTFTGDNTNGFTINNGSGNLGYTSNSNRKLAFGDYTTKWKVFDHNNPQAGVYLQHSEGSSYYTITENSTGTTPIRGYASNTKYRSIYLFKKGNTSTTYYMTNLICNTKPSRYLTPKYRGDSGGT